MRYLWCVLALLWASVASATSVESLSLEQIVAKSEVIVIAKVEAVDMVDGKGRPVTDPKARTGPGSENQIRLHLVLDDVIISSTGGVPVRLMVPLWQMWHYELGSMQELVGKKSIFLLKGQRGTYEPAYYNDFQRPPRERRQILKLLGL